jgi:hypothetical protein
MCLLYFMHALITDDNAFKQSADFKFHPLTQRDVGNYRLRHLPSFH